MEKLKTGLNSISNTIKYLFHLKDNELFRIAFIFVFSLTGFIIALLGSIVGTWGVKMVYFPLFLTNQINLIIAGYYGVKTFSYIYDKDLYKRISNVKYHAVFTTYIMFVFMVIVVFLGPLSLLDNKLEVGPGSVPETVKNTGNGIMSAIENIFVHVATPLFVFYDYFKTKHDKKEVEDLAMKNVLIWQIYFIVYFFFTNILGATTGVFLYSIIDFEYWGWAVIIFYPTLVFVYWGLIAIVIFVKKYLMLREDLRSKDKILLTSKIIIEAKVEDGEVKFIETKIVDQKKPKTKKTSKQKPKKESKVKITKEVELKTAKEVELPKPKLAKKEIKK